MAISDVLRPDGPDYDGFLYAFIGEDRNGTMVTVLSILARLGLDPWREASELASLSEGAALRRLGAILEKSGDVPGPSCEHPAIARKLVSLLPARATRPPPSRSSLSSDGGRSRVFVTILAITVLIIVLAQILIPGASGLGSWTRL